MGDKGGRRKQEESLSQRRLTGRETEATGVGGNQLEPYGRDPVPSSIRWGLGEGPRPILAV